MAGDGAFPWPVVISVGAVLATAVLFWLRAKRKPFLDKSRKAVKLSERIQVSHDTVLFRFALSSPSQTLGLPIGQHIKLFCPNPGAGKRVGRVKAGEWNGRADAESSAAEVERKYTPVSSDDDLGHVDFIIKVYKNGVLPQFPDGGKMSQHLDTLKIGETIDLQGPVGLVRYEGHGNFAIGKNRKVGHGKIAMMAGGTGITPMLQVIRAILKDPSDKTDVSLLFGNQTENDILCKEELDALPKDRIKVIYTVDRPSAAWSGESGFITAEMIQKHLPGPGTCAVMICGPPPMVQHACKANLEKLGYPAGDLVVY